MGVQSIKSNPAMISLLVLVASATCAPQYGPPPPLPPTRPPPVPTPSPSPEKLVAPVTPAVACIVAYVTVWDTEYHDHENEVCETVYEQVCNTELQRLCQPTTRQECTTHYEQQCSTIYKNVCVQKYRTEYQPYTETECKTEYKQDCQYAWKGTGNDKVWSPIEGTCQNVPYDSCKEVAKTHARQVAYQECHDVPERKCSLVPEQVCVNVPDEVCQQVPKQQCHSEHKKFPIRISRQEAKKVCNVPGQPKTPSPLAPSIPVAVVPTFTAPAPVPSSPAFNQQSTFEDSQPLDRQRGVAFEDEDDHASIDVPTSPLEEMDDKKPSTQLQGGLSTLDEILAARRANAKPQPTLSEKLVFSS